MINPFVEIFVNICSVCCVPATNPPKCGSNPKVNK